MDLPQAYLLEVANMGGDSDRDSLWEEKGKIHLHWPGLAVGGSGVPVKPGLVT